MIGKELTTGELSWLVTDLVFMVLFVSEYLNHQLCDLAKRYHHSLSKVDVSELIGTGQGTYGKYQCSR